MFAKMLAAVYNLRILFFGGIIVNQEFQPYQQEEPVTNPNAGKGLAVAALVMGILALINIWLMVPGIIFGILGIIFAAVARKQGNTGGMAIAGLIMSIIGLVLSGILLATCGPLFCQGFMEGLNEAGF